MSTAISPSAEELTPQTRTDEEEWLCTSFCGLPSFAEVSHAFEVGISDASPNDANEDFELTAAEAWSALQELLRKAHKPPAEQLRDRLFCLWECLAEGDKDYLFRKHPPGVQEELRGLLEEVEPAEELYIENPYQLLYQDGERKPGVLTQANDFKPEHLLQIIKANIPQQTAAPPQGGVLPQAYTQAYTNAPPQMPKRSSGSTGAPPAKRVRRRAGELHGSSTSNTPSSSPQHINTPPAVNTLPAQAVLTIVSP